MVAAQLASIFSASSEGDPGCAVTGTTQRATFRNIVGDPVHGGDASAHSIQELFLVMRFHSVHASKQSWSEQLGERRARGARRDAQVDVIAHGECVTATRPLPLGQPHAGHVAQVTERRRTPASNSTDRSTDQPPARRSTSGQSSTFWPVIVCGAGRARCAGR